MSIATKICLIFVILAGGIGIYLGAVRIPRQIAKLKDEKSASDLRVKTAENAKKAIEKDRDIFKSESETKGVEITSTKKELEDEKAKFETMKKAIDDAVAEKDAAELRAAKAKKDIEDLTQKSGDLPKKLQTELKAANDKLTALEAEKMKLAEDLKIAMAKIPSEGGSLPDGLSGKITAVDPKWDFVVLNIGAKAGVQNGGELTVSRAGKLIGRVKVTKVEANHSIGNMMKAWKKADVLEGDAVSVVKY